jgi:hypothetical protein
MPYIKAKDRIDLHFGSRIVAITNPGQLNYAFTETIRAYLGNVGTSYQTINDVLGAMSGAKLEFYRRVVAPYEDKKISENGDVYYVEGTTTNDDPR